MSFLHSIPGLNRLTDRGSAGSSSPVPPVLPQEPRLSAEIPQRSPQLVDPAQVEPSSSKTRSYIPLTALRNAVSSSPKPDGCTGSCPVHCKGSSSEHQLAIPVVALHAEVPVPDPSRTPDEVTQRPADAAVGPSNLHSFVATDDGIIGGATELLRGG